MIKRRHSFFAPMQKWKDILYAFSMMVTALNITMIGLRIILFCIDPIFSNFLMLCWWIILTPCQFPCLLRVHKRWLNERCITEETLVKNYIRDKLSEK